jgi:hypothetical protein
MDMENPSRKGDKKYEGQYSRLILTLFFHGILFFFLSSFSNQYCLCSGLK